jgi:DNA-binding MarR family transcriptional regulator/N-acetylglutamate synthase-like GNAT family acetyltransferase
MKPPAEIERGIAVIRGFNRFYTQRIGVLHEGLLDTPYPLTEMRVLYEIANRDGVMATELVAALGVDPGYLSRILSRFSHRGWLKKERPASDARKVRLSLTAKGRRVFAGVDHRSRDQVQMLLAPLSAPDRQRLLTGLEQVQALLQPPREPRRAAVALRTHRSGDMGWIVQRHGVLYTQEYGWNDQFEGLVAEIVGQFLGKFDAARERCWIAELDGHPVGCVMLVRDSDDLARLRLLLVEPAARGLGVGRALVDACVSFARECGYSKMTLWTQSMLTAARRIYESSGFRLVSSKPHHSFGADLVGENWELDLGQTDRPSV